MESLNETPLWSMKHLKKAPFPLVALDFYVIKHQKKKRLIKKTLFLALIV